jgi:excinuclease ABC subunit C
MQEVLQRRMKHAEWEKPGLIIVDGGKGQVSSAIEVLRIIGWNVPLIGLAKREETIVIPLLAGHSGEVQFKEVSLSKDAKALLLLMRIRDEAHRFAITYHRKLRSKAAVAAFDTE